MITLITGRPGHGKSLLTVSKVPEWFGGREVYYHGIKDLRLPWAMLEDPEKWYQLPDGAVIVLDEAQRVFPMRGASQVVPEKCRQLETHRHRGFDLVLITQDALLLDVHVRRLVGRHIHLQRNFGIEAAGVVQWDRLGDPTDKMDKAAATQWVFKYPKDSYKLYHSAEVHTVKRSIPLKLWLLLFAVIAAGATAWGGLDAIRSIASPKAGGDVGHVPKGDKSKPIRRVESEVKRVESPRDYVAKYQPRIPDLPYSAPVFDDLARPSSFPVVSGCMVLRGECRCYSQQGTRLAGISQSFCHDFVERGSFNMFEGGSHERRVPRQAPQVRGSDGASASGGDRQN